MRAMVALVVAMGVLIVVGVAVLGFTIVRRMATPAVQAAVTLAEPPGTRIVSVAAVADRLAVLLQGGGPDRLVLVDPRTGLVAGRVGLVP